MYEESDRSSDGKRSHNYSTAAPYIIPEEIMDQSKNLRTMIYKDDKSHYKSRVSFVDNYVIKTRYDNSSEVATQYELRSSLRPKISNKLHLEFPQKEKITVKRYVGEEKEIEEKVTGMFSKIFKCCVEPKIEKDYDECDYCEHRYYKPKKLGYEEEESDDDNRRESTQPYISYKRLSEREKQPIQVFYQEVTNEDIQNNRFLDNSDDYLYHSKLNKSKRRE